jgi:hypothetical protein
VPLPASIAAALETFATVVTFGLDDVTMAPLACVGLHGYVPRLLFWMMLPVALALLSAVLVVVSSVGVRVLMGKLAKVQVMRMSRSRSDVLKRGTTQESIDFGEKSLLFHVESDDDQQRPKSIFEKTLYYLLLILFVLYPKVTNVAFEGFPCCACCSASNA